MLGSGEEVTELKLEVTWVIESLCMLGALQVEPKDGVHDASVVEDAVFQCLLHQTVDIVFFEGGAFVRPLHGWLVEKVHFTNLIII